MGGTLDSDDVRALVYENVADAVFYLRVEGERFRFAEVNPAFLRATGLTSDAVLGRHVDEIIPEPSLSLVLAKYREAIAARRTVRWEEVTPYPSGKKHGAVSITPVMDEHGVCQGLVGTVHDVTEIRRTEETMRAEQRVLEMIASGETLEASLTTLVRAIEEQAPPAIASVLLLAPDGKHVMHGAAPGLPEEYNRAIDGAAIGPSAGSCGTAAYHQRPVIVTDVETDPSWKDYRDLARRFGLRACWSTPIVASSGRMLGTFALYYRTPRSPTDDDLQLIARATHVAGIAIQRREIDDQLHALASRLEAVREEERTRIARDIHDVLGQMLTALKMDVAWIGRRASSEGGITSEVLLARVRELSEMTDGLIREVRRISSELRPGILDDLGLGSAIAWEAEELERRTGIVCAVSCDLDERVVLGRELSTAVFRAFQEALTNVVRHAQAQHVEVDLVEEDGFVVLVVRDDGRGIDAAAIDDRRSLGLVGIRERARRLGGTATFARKDVGGTVVTLRLPREAPPSSSFR